MKNFEENSGGVSTFSLAAKTVLGSAREKVDTPPEFYEYYYWGNIILYGKMLLHRRNIMIGRSTADHNVPTMEQLPIKDELSLKIFHSRPLVGIGNRDINVGFFGQKLFSDQQPEILSPIGRKNFQGC